MRVMVADDHPLYREAVATQIRRLYPDAVVDEVASLDDLRAAVSLGDPCDLMLVDYYMPGVSDTALATLLQDYPDIPVAVISGTARSGDVRKAVEAGARCFIPKTAGSQYFAHALQMLIAGGSSIPSDMLLDRPASPDADWLAQLTMREREVLRALGSGKSNKEIARELGLAEVTIKLHLRNLFRKMAVKSRSEAAVMAVKAGLG